MLVESFPLNVLSSEKLYVAGGYHSRNNLMNKLDEVIGTIDVPKRGFLLQVVGGALGQRDSGRAMTMKAAAQDMMLWHQRLAYSSYDDLDKTFKATKGGPKDHTPFTCACEVCELAKSVRFTPKQPRQRARHALERLHADLCEIKPVTYDGHRYTLLITDDKSRYRIIHLLRTKGSATSALTTSFDWLEAQYRRPKEVQIDGGKELWNGSTRLFMRQRGTTLTLTPAHGHEQAGFIERSHCIVLDKARAIILASGIPPELWGEILTAAVDITNITATSRLEWKTPAEVFYDDVRAADEDDEDRPNRPDITHLRTLGCRAFINIEPEKQVKAMKMQPQAFEGILVGYKERHLYKI